MQSITGMIQIQNDNKLKLFVSSKSNYLFKCQPKSVFLQDSSFHSEVKEDTHPYRSVNGEHNHEIRWESKKYITVDCTEITKGCKNSRQAGASENCTST